MKKIFLLVAPVLFAGISSVHAQSDRPVPPPPPPKPPITVIEEKVKVEKVNYKVIKKPPVVTVKGKMADEFYKRNPSVEGISRQENIVSVKKKDGAMEQYDMSKKEEDKNFTEKYGTSPIPPPPPPKIVFDKKVKIKTPPPKPKTEI